MMISEAYGSCDEKSATLPATAHRARHGGIFLAGIAGFWFVHTNTALRAAASLLSGSGHPEQLDL